ncbi:hypothetical protein [Litorimonas sp. WD9-15]|uniref:[protein-PII] uridylyltransferase family protein n=1 Tax=Litorimonas sp. WD9-15 TaxID=3418716 RepID=UPI003CFCCC7D
MSAHLRHSDYLSGLATRFARPGTCADILAEVAQASADDLTELKARFALAFAKTKFEGFDEAGRIWSGFADATIDRASVLAWQIASKRHRLSLTKGTPSGFFILGLGKLGGLDLNFSSDVDLLAFYDPETLPVPATKGQAYIASEVCKNLTQILQPRHAPDFVWRVDWRLRPESSGTGLAMSTTKAETFYFFRALPWHRLALMKARVVGGDKNAGEDFLAALEPFIWRRNLDFTMLDELAALKSRINDEHPGLESERKAPAPITPKAAGFNIKLGRGGIREIEFIANAQQLVHGGKRPALRTTNTREALRQLREEGLLPSKIVADLLERYAHFRDLENSVQMLNNEQTHIVPAEQDQENLLGLLNYPENFDADIYKRRQSTHAVFSKLFETAKTESTSVDLAELEGTSKEIARSWSKGFSNHGIAPAISRNFQELGRKLVTRVQRQNSPDAFQTVDAFLKQLGRSEQYFTLLARHPNLLDTLVTPLLHSPHMTEILRQSPHIIDIFLSPAAATLEAQSAFVLSSPDYERRLESLRRFVNEQLFRAYTRFLNGESDAAALQAKLTAIAELTLTLSIRIVADDLEVEHIPLTVLGLGKMGTSTMAPESDLDLVFLFADDCDPDLSAQVVRRLRTTLMTKLREGIAYELDMRLRPSGRSGPPAVKLSAFYDHHVNRAHTWEHIALAPARIVAGDTDLGQQVIAIKSEILTRPRNRDAFLSDAWSMYQRIRAERITDTPPDVWRSKLREGGLMQADFLLSSYAVLGELPPNDLAPAADAWRDLQIWERLLGLKGRTLAETPNRFESLITDRVQPKLIKQLQNSVQSAADILFTDIQQGEHPDPAPIIWDKL